MQQIVKLRKGGESYRCPETGWNIIRGQEKTTPSKGSRSIRDAIGAGRLIVVTNNKYQQLVDLDVMNMDKTQLDYHIAAINTATGENTIATDLTIKDGRVAIKKWAAAETKKASAKMKKAAKGAG